MREFADNEIGEFAKDGFSISTDKTKLNLETIHNFLKTSYWAQNVPLAVVQKSIEHSLCFGVYEGGKQIGFARVISDLCQIRLSTFASAGMLAGNSAPRSL